MTDARFFIKAGPFSIDELARIASSQIAGAKETPHRFLDVKPLSAAGPTDVSFIDNRRYVADFETTKAGAIVVAPDLVDRAPAGAALLVMRDPYRGYALIAQAFYPVRRSAPTIAANASIAPDATVGKDVAIGPGAVVGALAQIGDRTTIGPNTVIGDGVQLGADCIVASNCTLTHCEIGERVILHPGVRIGQDGFGFAPGAQGHTKVPQLGRVLVGDDVEIGANSTIDRGAGPDTVIGAGTKIDNLVQIGHNVSIGKGCLIVAQVGISGSTRIGDFVMIGGQAGLTGHLKIGDGARIAAQSGVSRDVAARATVAGSPAEDARAYWRDLAFLRRLRTKSETE
jgi:UDP-3-O-[3-hydroxymyristoyl] glucosamine N-acyltransferase